MRALNAAPLATRASRRAITLSLIMRMVVVPCSVVAWGPGTAREREEGRGGSPPGLAHDMDLATQFSIAAPHKNFSTARAEHASSTTCAVVAGEQGSAAGDAATKDRGEEWWPRLACCSPSDWRQGTRRGLGAKRGAGGRLRRGGRTTGRLAAVWCCLAMARRDGERGPARLALPPSGVRCQ